MQQLCLHCCGDMPVLTQRLIIGSGGPTTAPEPDFGAARLPVHAAYAPAAPACLMPGQPPWQCPRHSLLALRKLPIWDCSLPSVCAVWGLVPRPDCGVQHRKRCTPVSHLLSKLAVISSVHSMPHSWQHLGHMVWGLRCALTACPLSGTADAAVLCTFMWGPCLLACSVVTFTSAPPPCSD